MVEMIVFALTLVVAQSVAGFIRLKYVMSERFLRKYTKKAMKVSEEAVAQMFKED